MLCLIFFYRQVTTKSSVVQIDNMKYVGKNDEMTVGFSIWYDETGNIEQQNIHQAVFNK